MLLATAILVAGLPAAAADELTRLKYNHPGLVVDLGVGLWAWPVPCDADGDGDFDLIVSCPDKPSNGVWLFENATGDTAQTKFPVFKPARRLSHTVHYVMPSYVDDQLRVLTPGVEYSDFTTSGLDARHAARRAQNHSRAARQRARRPGQQDSAQPVALCRLRRRRTARPDRRHRRLERLRLGRRLGCGGPLDQRPAARLRLSAAQHGHNRPAALRRTVRVEADGQPVDTFGCPSPNFADFDGDGDLDLLCGEFLDRFTYFENIGTRTEPRYADGRRPLCRAAHRWRWTCK